MLSNLIRLLSIRSLLTLGINLSRSQLLKSNRSLNRLRHITINSDLNINLASRLLRSKGLLTLTNHRLVCLINQFRIQGVLLPWDQVLVLNGIGHLSTSNNLISISGKLSLSRNLRIPILAAVVVRESGLIRRQNTLAAARGMLINSVWPDNSQECISGLLINFNAWINIELIVEVLSGSLYDTKPRQLCKFLRAALKSLETRHVVGVSIA